MFIIVLSMLLPTLFVGGCLYYFIFTVLAEQLTLPDLIASDLMPVIQKINVILAIGLPLVFIAILSWAAVLSYRFIAPLERLEEDLEKIDNGDYSARLEIRDDHELKPIADVINDLVDKLDKKKE